MEYIPLLMPHEVSVKKLYSMHYFQFASGYVFPGEKHDFWEMVYIDQGEADIGAGKRTVRLSQGQIIFHKPNEFHSIWANYADAPNIFVVSFEATPAFMRQFRGLQISVSAAAKRILQLLLDEGFRCFGPLLSQSNPPIPLREPPVASVQLIRNYLEQLLISIARTTCVGQVAQQTGKLTDAHQVNGCIEQATAFMKAHLHKQLCMRDICEAMSMSPSALKAAFHSHTGMGMMAYYRRLRLEEARRLLREGKYNINEISELLNYSSVHAFSRQFKQMLGLSPSQYVRSIRL